MANLIGGVIGVLGIVVFLGFYAIKIRSTPLWVIIVVVLVLAAFDFVQSVRKDRGGGS